MCKDKSMGCASCGCPSCGKSKKPSGQSKKSGEAIQFKPSSSSKKEWTATPIIDDTIHEPLVEVLPPTNERKSDCSGVIIAGAGFGLLLLLAAAAERSMRKQAA